MEQDAEGKWWMTYLYRDPEVVKRQQAIEKKEKIQLDEEERLTKLIEKQRKKALEEGVGAGEDGLGGGEDENAEIEKQMLDENAAPIKLAIEPMKTITKKDKKGFKPIVNPFDQGTVKSDSESEEERKVESKSINAREMDDYDGEDDKSTLRSAGSKRKRESGDEGREKGKQRAVSSFKGTLPSSTIVHSSSSSSSSHPSSSFSSSYRSSSSSSSSSSSDALEAIKRQQEIRRESENRRDYWLAEGIVVKVVHKDLGNGKYHRKKGVVQKVADKYIGTVKLFDIGAVLALDQQYLETVIPNIGGRYVTTKGDRESVCALEKIGHLRNEFC